MIDTNALKSITQIHLLGNIPLSPTRQAPISVVCMAMRTSKVAPVCMSNKEGQCSVQAGEIACTLDKEEFAPFVEEMETTMWLRRGVLACPQLEP